MRRQRFLYAAGLFIGGMWLTSLLYTTTYGQQIGSSTYNVVISWIALAYVVIFTIFTVKDRRSK